MKLAIKRRERRLRGSAVCNLNLTHPSLRMLTATGAVGTACLLLQQFNTPLCYVRIPMLKSLPVNV